MYFELSAAEGIVLVSSDLNHGRAIIECCTPHSKISPVLIAWPSGKSTDRPLLMVWGTRKSP
jgi:hypothetical protein